MSPERSILEDPARDTTAVADPEPVAPVAHASCPRCGAPMRDAQDWCLNCGTAVTTRVAGAPGWRTPLAIVAGILAVALAAVVVAFLAVSSDTDEQARVASTPAQSAPAPAPVSPTPQAGATPAPETLPPATAGNQPPASDSQTSPASGSAVASWPARKSAWTVVLLSSPRRAVAEKRARRLSAAGTDVGVLDSDDFKSLRGGYFVVFSGQYGSRTAAERALGGLRADAPEAYVRRVTPR